MHLYLGAKTLHASNCTMHLAQTRLDSLKTHLHFVQHHQNASRCKCLHQLWYGWLASRVARHPDHLAMRCANGMMIRTVSA